MRIYAIGARIYDEICFFHPHHIGIGRHHLPEFCIGKEHKTKRQTWGGELVAGHVYSEQTLN